MLFIHFHEKFLVYKLETFKNCKDVKRIMIMIIAIICIFLILWDIWSTVENYLQKILCLPPFKVQKVQGPPFCQHWQFFSPPPPAERGGGGHHFIQGLHKIVMPIVVFWTHVAKVMTSFFYIFSLISDCIIYLPTLYPFMALNKAAA